MAFRPIQLDGPVTARVFDSVLQAMGTVSCANFKPDVEPPDYFGGVVPEHGYGTLWLQLT